MGPESGTFLPPEIEVLLSDMGLSAGEIRVYQFLHKEPHAVASAIASSAGESRGRIYETVRRLVEKGFVREEPTRPLTFSAVPLVDVVSRAQLRLAKHAQTLKDHPALVVQVHESGARTGIGHPMAARDVAVMSGRKACNAELRRMAADANELFWMIGGGRFADRLRAMPEFVAQLRSAAARGVDVNVFLAAGAHLHQPIGEPGGGAVAWLHEVPLMGDEPVLTCVTEQCSMEVVVQPDDDSPNAGADLAILTRGAALVEAAKRNIQAESKAAQVRSRAALFQWLGPNHGTDLFLSAINTARGSVDVIGPSNWAQFLAGGQDELARAYTEARSRGVRFRALVPAAGRGSGPSVLPAVWDVRIVPWIPLFLTVVDGREVYQAFAPSSPTFPPQFRQSTEANEVHFYQELFNRLWKTGHPPDAA